MLDINRFYIRFQAVRKDASILLAVSVHIK